MQGPGCQCRMGRLSVSRTTQRETVCIYRYWDMGIVVDYHAFGCVVLRVRKSGVGADCRKLNLAIIVSNKRVLFCTT
jgi:hypothetical protein